MDDDIFWGIILGLVLLLIVTCLYVYFTGKSLFLPVGVLWIRELYSLL
jgi:hypothetical protein